jgi:hypothetical protein
MIGVDKSECDSITVYAAYTKDGKLHWHTFNKWKMKLWMLWQKAKVHEVSEPLAKQCISAEALRNSVCSCNIKRRDLTELQSGKCMDCGFPFKQTDL